MTEAFVKAIVENGIGVGLAIAITFMFYKILMHVLGQQKEVLSMATSQNRHWQTVITELKTEIKNASDVNAEAHKYQREEHKVMMETLKK